MQLVNFSGIVSKIGTVEKYGKDQSFPVQRVIVEQVSGPWEVSFAGDSAVKEAEGLSVGDKAMFECDLQCRAWKRPDMEEPKYFLSLNVVKVIPDVKKEGFKTEPVGADITKIEDVPF
jgi:hypothetical protein